MENPKSSTVFFCLMSVAEEQRLEWLGNRLEQQGSKGWNFKRSRKKQTFLNESIEVRNNKIHEDRTGHPTISTGYFSLISSCFIVLVIFLHYLCIISGITYLTFLIVNSSHVNASR